MVKRYVYTHSTKICPKNRISKPSTHFYYLRLKRHNI